MNAGFLQEILLSREEVAKCQGALSKLARHLEEPVIITGSIAANWHLLRNGKRINRRQLNDLDIVVEGLSSLPSSLSEDFLINHFHPNRGRGRILIQLVDEETTTRIDVFTPTTKTLTERLTYFVSGEIQCRIVSVEDLSAILLTIIHPVVKGESIEPKYFERFQLLSTMAEWSIMQEIWPEYRKEGQPLDFEEAAETVHRGITAHPGLLQAVHYNQDVNWICQWCSESELFPLAPRTKIYGILGYV